MIISAQHVQISQLQTAPWGTQQRQPIDPVGAMEQRTGQNDQILNVLTVGQPLDFHRLKTLLGGHPAQRGDQCLQMAARPHQDGDTFFGISLARFADDLQQLVRFDL